MLLYLVLFSSVSFYLYAYFYFKRPHMKNEFKRLHLEKIGLATIGLEILGASGLLLGLKYPSILFISALGLGLLMLAGLIARLLIKDPLKIAFPAIFYMILNFYISYESFLSF